MRIAVNAGLLSDSLFNLFLNIAASNPEDSFFFIFDNSVPDNVHFPETVIPVVIQRKSNKLFSHKIWYNYKLPRVLKKLNADIFISKNLLSLKTEIPQILLFPDLSFLFKSSFLEKKQLNYYKKQTPQFICKANKIVVHSQFLKNTITRYFEINEENIKVIYPEIRVDFKELSFEDRESIKEKYTEGNEYFIYHGIISPQQNLVNLLKAFSYFKKRQRSGMQLIISGIPGTGYEAFKESLRLFRFNKEVKVMDGLSLSETDKIIAAAYAMVLVPVVENESTTALEALRNQIPAIVSVTGSLPEMFGEAALYAHPENFKDVAEKMMLLFKDENLRKNLVRKGEREIKKFTHNNYAQTFLQLIKSPVIKNPH